QTGFSQELLDTAANHLLDDFSWLTLDLVFVEADEHGFLALDRFSRHFRWQQELRVAGRYVHGNVFSQVDGTALEYNHYTDLVAVQVRTQHVTFDTRQATDVDVLAALGNQGQTGFFLSCDQRLNFSQLVSEGFLNTGSYEIFEIVLQGQEVSLRV